MLHVEEINDRESLTALRAEWAALHGQTKNATFFQSLDWLEVYLRHYGDKQRMRVLVVRNGGKAIGIVPLVVLREKSVLGPVRVLTYPLDYWGSFYGPVGPEPRQTLATALDHIRRTRRDWDLLDLRFTPRSEIDDADTETVLAETGFTAHAKRTDHATLIDLPSTLDEYLAGRTPKFRNGLRRWARRLNECGNVQFVRYRPAGIDHGDDDPRWDLYDACEAVARRSWQGSATDGTTITHDSVRPFLRDVHETACRAGAADISLFYLDGKAIAFLYCYAHRGYVYGMRTGFDPNGPKCGVGNLLYLRVIEDCIARGDRMLDLGAGYLEAKRLLVTRVEPIYRRTYGNPLSWPGGLWHVKRLYERLLGGKREIASVEHSQQDPQPDDRHDDRD